MTSTTFTDVALDQSVDTALTTALLLLAVAALARPLAAAAHARRAAARRVGAAGRGLALVAPVLLPRLLRGRGAAVGAGLAAAAVGPLAGPVLALDAAPRGEGALLPDLDRAPRPAAAPAATSRAPSATPTGSAPGSVSPAPTASHYRVRAGDCLWRIAAAHLPAGADDATIDAAWRQWYRLNREAIGADPDLIDVGLVLRVIAGATAVTR
jgi:nucleoid-associated protein YgaU